MEHTILFLTRSQCYSSRLEMCHSIYSHMLLAESLAFSEEKVRPDGVAEKFKFLSSPQVGESCTYRTKSYEILQEHRKGCASCNIVQESCEILFNLTVRSYIKINLYDFL